jgi:hypothetical protein
MRGISVKAFAVANLVDIGLTVVGGFAIMAVAFVIEGAVLGPGSIGQAMPTLMATVWFGPLLYLWIALADVAAGYVAARIADESVLLNAALSSLAKLLFLLGMGFYITLNGPVFHPEHHVQVPESLALAVTFGGPVFGFLGGLAAPKIEPRILFRWLFAFPAAAVVYLIVLLVNAKFHSTFMPVLAAAFAIIAGALVAPAEYRKQAFIGFIVVAIAIPSVVLLWRVAGGAGSVPGFMWVFYNAMGGVFARILTRQMWKAWR